MQCKVSGTSLWLLLQSNYLVVLCGVVLCSSRQKVTPGSGNAVHSPTDDNIICCPAGEREEGMLLAWSVSHIGEVVCVLLGVGFIQGSGFVIVLPCVRAYVSMFVS